MVRVQVTPRRRERFVLLRQANRHCLWPLRTRADLENDLLALFEDLVAPHINGGVVNENVLPATFDRDKAVAFFSVEPLDGSVRHCYSQLLCYLLITSIEVTRFSSKTVQQGKSASRDHNSTRIKQTGNTR